MAVNEGSDSGEKIMVAIDESETSCYALTWVLENLQESTIKSSHPLVLFMAQPPARNGNFFTASLNSARMLFNVSCTPDISNAGDEQDRMILILEKAKNICTSYGVNAEIITVVGDAKEAICDAVEKYNINVLVLGDHGAQKSNKTVFGSVSNYCASKAKCSVLIVKKIQ